MVVGQPGKLVPALRVVSSSLILVVYIKRTSGDFPLARFFYRRGGLRKETFRLTLNVALRAGRARFHLPARFAEPSQRKSCLAAIAASD